MAEQLQCSKGGFCTPLRAFAESAGAKITRQGHTIQLVEADERVVSTYEMGTGGWTRMDPTNEQPSRNARSDVKKAVAEEA